MVAVPLLGILWYYFSDERSEWKINKLIGGADPLVAADWVWKTFTKYVPTNWQLSRKYIVERSNMYTYIYMRMYVWIGWLIKAIRVWISRGVEACHTFYPWFPNKTFNILKLHLPGWIFPLVGKGMAAQGAQVCWTRVKFLRKTFASTFAGPEDPQTKVSFSWPGHLGSIDNGSRSTNNNSSQQQQQQ